MLNSQPRDKKTIPTKKTNRIERPTTQAVKNTRKTHFHTALSPAYLGAKASIRVKAKPRTFQFSFYWDYSLLNPNELEELMGIDSELSIPFSLGFLVSSNLY